MNSDVATIFPNAGLRLLSTIIHFLGVTICTYCFAHRSANDELWSWRGWTRMSIARACVLALFIDSWLFLFFTGILINGVGLSYSAVACSLAIYSCIFAYAVSKIFVYFFLIEKVHIVWRTSATSVQRLKSPVYRLCLAVMAPYLAIVVIMIVGKIAIQRGDGVCVIGLQHYASIPLISYDLFVNVFLTGMFLWPILRSRFSNPNLKAVARRTLIAAVAGLTTSCVNMGILTIEHGQELGWICLASCGADVVINAIVIYWVTGSFATRNALPLTPIALDKTAHTSDRRASVPHALGVSYPVDLAKPKESTSGGGMFKQLPRMLSGASTNRDQEKSISVQVTIVRETLSDHDYDVESDGRDTTELDSDSKNVG